MDTLLIREAIEHLKKARDKLREARAPNALAKVRLALKSAEGAERHAQNLDSRARFSDKPPPRRRKVV